MEKTCPDCGHKFNPEMIEELKGACPRCMADLLRSETELLNTADLDGLKLSGGGQPLEPGATYHGMEIVELLGRGGMGFVYKARQPKLNRDVALKILDPRLAKSAGFTARFNREAKALAALNHPNIVQVYDYGHEEDYHFLVMEFIDGANLREILLTSRVEPSTALRYVPQICDALEYAHTEGVIHRDIKPENILIDKRGNLKIADFGLAKITTGDAEAKVTLTREVMGTPNYMAPEQMQEMASVDHRADIYSLGVVFYEMLTGELPVGRFPTPSEAVEVDIRLDEVVLKALEKDPQRRYQHVSQVRDDIADTVSSGSAAQTKIGRSPVALSSKEDAAKFADVLDTVWIGYLIAIVGLFVPIIDLSVCSLVGFAVLAVVLLRQPHDQRDLRLAGIFSSINVVAIICLSVASVLSLISPVFSIMALPVLLIQLACSLIVYWKIIGKTGSALADAGHAELSRSMYSVRIGYLVYFVLYFALVVVVGLAFGIALHGGIINDPPHVQAANLLGGSILALALLPIDWLFGWLLILRPIRRASRALRGDGAESDDTGPHAYGAESQSVGGLGTMDLIRKVGLKTASIFSLLTFAGSVALLGLTITFCYQYLPILIGNARLSGESLPRMTVPVVNTFSGTSWPLVLLGLLALFLILKEILLWRRPWSRLGLNLLGAFAAVAVTTGLGFASMPVMQPDISYRSSHHYAGDSVSYHGGGGLQYLEHGIFMTEHLDGATYHYLISDTRDQSAGADRVREDGSARHLVGCGFRRGGLAVYYTGDFGLPGWGEDTVELVKRPPPGQVTSYTYDKNGKRIAAGIVPTAAGLKKIKNVSTFEEALAVLQEKE